MREGCQIKHMDSRLGLPIFSLSEEGMAPGMEMSIGECEELSYTILLGLDLTEEFPVVWLRLKQAINRGARVIFIGHFAPEIAPHLAKTVLHAPGEELQAIKQNLSLITSLGKEGKKGAFFVGRQYLASSERSPILSELAKIQKTIPGLSLNVMEGKGNSMGARFAGMHPELGPLGQRLKNPGLNAIQIIEAAAQTGWDFLYVAGVDLIKHFPPTLWKQARQKLGFMVVQDLFLTETAEQADVVLPTLSFAEKWGSFVNIEGRVQKLFPGKEIPQSLYSDGEIFRRLAEKMNLTLDLDLEFTEALKQNRFSLNRPEQIEPGQTKEAKREDGTLRATFASVLFDEGTRMRHDLHLSKLTPEQCVRLNSFEGAKRGIRTGDRVRLTNNGHSIHVKVKLDERVANETVIVPLGFSQIPAHEFGSNLMNGLPVNVEHEKKLPNSPKPSKEELHGG